MKIKTWGFMLGILLLTAGADLLHASPYNFGQAGTQRALFAQADENSSVPGSGRRDDRRYEKPDRTLDADLNLNS